ncbi:MAG: histidine kinase [Spirochaetales bacterium]|nr:histidine kinase [Spirochaetales bacterium]
MEENEKKLLEQRLAEMKNELDERNGSIPIHSIRPHQLIEIEELEDRITDLEKRFR